MFVSWDIKFYDYRWFRAGAGVHKLSEGGVLETSWADVANTERSNRERDETIKKNCVEHIINQFHTYKAGMWKLLSTPSPSKDQANAPSGDTFVENFTRLCRPPQCPYLAADMAEMSKYAREKQKFQDTSGLPTRQSPVSLWHTLRRVYHIIVLRFYI